MWQINRPRRSKVMGEVLINRFATWSVLRRDELQLVTGGASASATATATATAFAVKLGLDIYSDPIMPLPAESMERLYKELISSAEEIMERGDIA